MRNWLVTLVVCCASFVKAEKLTVNATATPALSAAATDTASGKSFTGTLSGNNFVFDLKPGRHYDVTLKRLGGGVLRLIDLSWYDAEPPAANAGALGDDDRAAITQIVTDIKQFTNHNQIIALVGDGDRAVALLDLRRDSGFHSDQGGEIIRRIEVWYFKNEAGGWAKVQQEDRLVDRQRFSSSGEFDKAYAGETWQPLASGLNIARDHESAVVADLVATTRPAK